MKRSIYYLLFGFLVLGTCCGQAQKISRNTDVVYVDQQGVLRWKQSNKEAAFFGVNYSTPFAFAYRAHRALGIDLEKAIQQDVYHLARLGFDAFRVHVWDTEISDTTGNLLNNDHLRLFDFLLAELKKRNIKTIITPIAFWGNGYPERDEATPGFSRKYGKGRSTTNDTAIKAQENYLQQFFTHINPYTKLTYKDDPDIIAIEINNEPSHSGPKSNVTNYINRLNAAVRRTGWTKPVFYNISQNPSYADAVAASDVNGFSMQWYPTGLVANHTIGGNFLPHVDLYSIPFDTIPRYAKKALMIYEFDAADVNSSYLYPAMARSFKSAGFQWATQFAYDPMALANVNTEYQTHYVNLTYTPSKAISLMIASEAFRRIPRLKTYGTYPADTLFDVFRVSYKEALSEMNAEDRFYYSNHTNTQPRNIKKLQRLVGVGNSPVVQYTGSGAYFLDRLADGVWRLEVMPDAIPLRDPFERASPKKEVTRVQWQQQSMKILLPELESSFTITSLNEGNTTNTKAENNQFVISPGTYLVSKTGENNKTAFPDDYAIGAIRLREFVAPQSASTDVRVHHQPVTELSAGKPFTLKAIIAGIDSTAKVSIQVNRLGGGYAQFRNIIMKKSNGHYYTAEIPADILSPGQITYRIIVQKNEDDIRVFPGNHKGNPFAWDYYHNENWTSFVAAEDGDLQLFNAADNKNIRIYPSRRGYQTTYTASRRPGQLLLRLSATGQAGDHVTGIQSYFGDRIKGRIKELNSFDRIVVRARATNAQPSKAKVSLITSDAVAYSADIPLSNQFQNIVVPLSRLQEGSFLLLPRPYPGFMPLRFKTNVRKPFTIADVEKLEITIGDDLKSSENNQPSGIEIESVWLEKEGKQSEKITLKQ